MAITFGNTGEGTGTLTINCNGDFLIVGLNTTSDNVTAVSFNGDAMTQIGTTLNHSGIGRYMMLWGLANPDQGSLDVSITGGANLSSTAACISGYSSNSGFNSGTSATSSISVSVTTTVDNAYVVSYGVYVSFSSNGTGVSDLKVQSDPNVRMSRSTDAVTPAGAFATVINSSGSNLNGMLAVGINPVAASGPANLKSLNTNLKANIKSINTNVIANIKSLNTNV